MRKTKYSINHPENETGGKRYQVMNKFGKAPWMYLPISVLTDLLFHRTITGVAVEDTRLNEKVINLITIIQ
jgi:hypothetical protein